MSLTLVTPPVTILEEVLLSDCKAHLRIDDSTEDALLVGMLAAARGYLEGRDGIAHRALLTQTWDWRLDAWPRSGPLEPPLAPLQSVTSITVRDATEVSAVWASSNYQVATGDGLGRIQPIVGGSWPQASLGLHPITVRFVAGYGAGLDSLPPGLRQWLVATAGELYTYRDAAGEPPAWIDRLLRPHRLVSV